jgi:anti-sigma regulatory factor (Ser/Thr protein kinase)
MPDHPAAPAAQTASTPELRPADTIRVTASPSWRELTCPVAAGDRAAISTLRRLAHAALDLWGITTDQAQDIVVVLSELATNAVLHTDGPARIRLHAHTHQITLDVADTGPNLPDFDTGPDADSEEPHGFGLALVASTLADALTVTRHPERGKTVTATFAIK